MKVGIGFSLQNQYNLPIEQVITLLRKHNFSAVSPVWTPQLDIATIAACVKEHNMIIQSLHATHTNIAFLWDPDNERSFPVFKNIMQSIDDCARFGIPILVVHGWQGLVYSFPNEPLNFCLFDEFVQYAETQGVSVAFENLEGEEYLDALMYRYMGQRNVGYCWDSGHDNCYPHKIDFLEKFGERLIMTHLNDNLGLRDENGIPSGDDDLHFIPHDGTIDWDKTLGKLQNAKIQDILNFEIKNASHSKRPGDLLYMNIPLEDFIAKAGKMAQRIADKYAQDLVVI